MSNELTRHEREVLQYWLRSRQSLRAIAKLMRRDVSVLSREIKRNSPGRERYRADVAMRLHEARKHKGRAGKLDTDKVLRDYVEEKLAEEWSPEQISGRLLKSPPAELAGKTISHESIYYWIYEKSFKEKKLYTHLRTHRPKRRPKGRKKHTKTRIPNRVSIHARPEAVHTKQRFGDWESDTVEFRRKQKNPYLSVQFERKSQLARIHKVPNKTSEATKNAIIRSMETVPRELQKTMTFDNGTEGSEHAILHELYDMDTYFCDPFSSWQKGGVENLNKLIRQYLPRSTDMNVVSEEQIYEIQEKLNNRPRKGLNYLTPNEVIQKLLHA